MKDYDDLLDLAIAQINLTTAVIALKAVRETKKNPPTKTGSKRKTKK
ncbi:MAG: hypothetical protein AB2421_19620 [Thermotaleaceae bacterium]